MMKEKVTLSKKDVGVVNVAPDGTPRIAAATAVAVRARSGLSKAIEAAMQQAIVKAAEDGIGADKPEEIKARMMAAREEVMKVYREAEAKAAAAAKAKAEAEQAQT